MVCPTTVEQLQEHIDFMLSSMLKVDLIMRKARKKMKHLKVSPLYGQTDGQPLSLFCDNFEEAQGVIDR